MTTDAKLGPQARCSVGPQARCSGSGFEGDGVAELFELVDQPSGAVLGGATALGPVRAEVGIVDVVVDDVPVGDEQIAAGRADGYLAGLVSGLDSGKGLAESLRLAAAAATANAMKPGAADFDLATAVRLRNAVVVQQVT